MGLKEGAVRGGVRNVSTGVSVIPDSAVGHFVAEDLSDGLGTWVDRSGAGNDLILQTAGEPTYESNGFNGHPSVAIDDGPYYDASNSNFQRPNTVIVAGELLDNATLNDWNWIVDSATGSSGTRNAVGWHQNGYWAARGDTGNDINGTTDNSIQLISAVFRTDLTSILREEQLQTAQGDTSASDMGPFRIGTDDFDVSGNASQVRIAEILICNGDLADTGELSFQEDMLVNKYDISI